MTRTTKTTNAISKSPLFFYEVNDQGTITDPTISEPKCNADVFLNLSTRGIETLDELISEIDSCPPLSQHFGNLANTEAEDLVAIAEDDTSLTKKQKKELAHLIEAMQSDPADSEGWTAWLEAAKPAQLPEFKCMVEDWLEEDIDWNQSDYFDAVSSGQGSAKGFFESEDLDVIDALQIEIIEGDHPGSTYYAAEIRLNIDEANRVATKLKLHYRFRSEGS